MTTFSLSEPATARFPIAQVSQGHSRAGVARGIHFTTTPPGCAKLAWCSAGRAIDFVVDLRVGSPTFGRVEAVELDPTSGVVVLPTGVGHAYQATTDDTVVSYLLSVPYDPAHEQSVALDDPELGVRLPLPEAPILSERDRAAPTLGEWRERGGLPDYEASRALDRDLGLLWSDEP